MALDWSKYRARGYHDELVKPSGVPRPEAKRLCARLAALSDREIADHKKTAEQVMRNMGITFTVYGEGSSVDRVWPFDVIPRVIRRREWDRIERGLIQRLKALNRFIDDLYNERRVLKDRVVPESLISGSKNYLAACRGIRPPRRVWAHVCGTDLVRDKNGVVYVLEDNLRIPSGVSYVLENRLVMKRTFPELFEEVEIASVDDYPSNLYDTLSSVSPRKVKRPRVVVLTPGVYNSAYFEHTFLAQQMGCELVEGRDLFVDSDDCVYMRTITGPQRVDVVYRRVDDEFLDPESFRPDSMLGVPGLMRAWKNGKVALANAPGTGVADDKVVYTFVPKLIEYYLGEKPILPNVPTYRCLEEKETDFVLKNLKNLVVKPANESGGYGILIGPKSTAAERARMKRKIRANPRNWVAQPLISLSTAPTLVGTRAEPRHLDLRPFVLLGRRASVTPGGLTRVALRKGSFVVNSSQGGGSKDTWVVD
jgi:uncharacterized circularly permuted ATP-grasp superfamily protein